MFADIGGTQGASDGEHRDGSWRAGDPEYAAGRWCDVFEIRDWKIQRCFIYLDPDYAGKDTDSATFDQIRNTDPYSRFAQNRRDLSGASGCNNGLWKPWIAERFLGGTEFRWTRDACLLGSAVSLTATPTERSSYLVLESHDGTALVPIPKRSTSPVSDAYTAIVDGLKALDPNRPIREADIVQHGGNVRFVPKEQTFRPLLAIIIGGQGYSSSSSITRETYPPTISASDRRRCCDSGFLTYCIGRNLSDAGRYWS